ncbi:MAG: OadG family protein [Bacteroidales bacterium]|nr:OadG family protein [Bacteroidales bacterium]
MEQSLGNAVWIMLIGMVTVFLILWLVVVIGNVLIRITNKYWPDTEEKKQTGNAHIAPSRKIAAIVTAVDIVTGGKGKVTQIKKV